MAPSPSSIFDRVLVTGADGQVGSALVKQIGPRHCVATTLQVLDLSALSTIRSRLDYFKPTAVINAAAYTAVDQAETEPDLAMTINGEAPGVMALWCAEKNIPFVHFSTDYVFPGTGLRPWNEDDAPAPVNAYGRSKVEGDRRVLAAGGRHLIFRSSWMYDESGKNFFCTILKLAAEQTELKIVSDQVGAPTYAPAFAASVIEGLERANVAARFPSGVYHLVPSGEISWHGFARAIFDGISAKGIPVAVQKRVPITTAEYHAAAKRPLNSRLSCDRAERVLGLRLPDWRVGLSECIDRYVERYVEKRPS